jgi:hypothetical protein
MLENAIKPRIREDKILRFLVEGTMSETGSEFFRALARNLSEALQTSGAWITEYLPETRRLRALAFWLNGGFLEHFEHAIDGTPCQAVIETKSRAHFPERLLELFPHDADLVALGAVSYMGTPLLDADGTLLGHLAVLDNRPMPAEPQLSCSIFSPFGLLQSSGGYEPKPQCVNARRSFRYCLIRQWTQFWSWTASSGSRV